MWFSLCGLSVPRGSVDCFERVCKKQLRKADSTVNRLKLPIHGLVPPLEPFWGAKKVKLTEDQKKRVLFNTS